MVFVAHVDEADLPSMERAARAVERGAPLLTGSWSRGYAGANGIIFSRGAMVTAAIAKGRRRTPADRRQALARRRRGDPHPTWIPTDEIAVIGDDVGMDIALGRMGGSKTVLVRSGITGATSLDKLPESRRPHAVIDRVADLLEHLP